MAGSGLKPSIQREHVPHNFLATKVSKEATGMAVALCGSASNSNTIFTTMYTEA